MKTYHNTMTYYEYKNLDTACFSVVELALLDRRFKEEKAQAVNLDNTYSIISYRKNTIQINGQQTLTEDQIELQGFKRLGTYSSQDKDQVIESLKKFAGKEVVYICVDDGLGLTIQVWERENYYIPFNYIDCLILSPEVVELCAHSGDCTDDVLKCMGRPEIKKQLEALDPEKLADELDEHGVWSEEQLDDHEDNLMRILWIAAGNVMDGECVGVL